MAGVEAAPALSPVHRWAQAARGILTCLPAEPFRLTCAKNVLGPALDKEHFKKHPKRRNGQQCLRLYDEPDPVLSSLHALGHLSLQTPPGARDDGAEGQGG